MESLWHALLPAVVLVLLLVGVTMALRRLTFLRLRRNPRVQISQFSTAGEGRGDEALWVTSLFRDDLKNLQLDGLDPVPDRAPGSPIVKVVESVGNGVGHGLELGKLASQLWRVGFPGAAYEVWATLSPSGPGEGAVSVQLVDLSRKNSTLVTYTSPVGPWEEGTKEAAMAVAGALYPHLSQAFKGPWSRWDEPVPPSLLNLYQDALKHESESKFEQALGGFRTTVKQDPLNPHLRLKVAMLEERLGLHLDAWFTYQAIVDEKHRKAWRGTERRIRLLALYRLAIHLWNRRVAEEWAEYRPNAAGAPPSGDDEYRAEVTRLREELLTTLRADPVFAGSSVGAAGGVVRAPAVDLLGNLAAERGGGETERLSLLEPFKDGDSSAERVSQVHEVLKIVSLRRLEELRDRMRVWAPRTSRRWRDRRSRRPPLRRWGRRKELSPLVVTVSELLVRSQIGFAVEADSGEAGNGQVPAHPSREALLSRWPCPGAPRSPTRTLTRLRLWISDFREDSWQLHYNAACTIASLAFKSSILTDQSEALKRNWARAAVKQLDVYARHAGSARVAAMADWIAFEDPDFAGAFFEQSDFRLWASQHLGFELGKSRGSRGYNHERHATLLLRRSARALASSWWDRAKTPSVSTEVQVEWWHEELAIWTQIQKVCRQRRSWRRRLEALEALEGWNAANPSSAVDLTPEKWDVLGKSVKLNGKLPNGLFTNLETAIGPGLDSDSEGILRWVKGSTEAVAAVHEGCLCNGLGCGPYVLSGPERARAVQAAKTWLWLDGCLGEALQGDEPKWGTGPLAKADART